MERPMVFLFIALVLVPASSYAENELEILTELRHGQREMMKQIENLEDAVTEVRQGQQKVVKQIEAIKATAPISNKVQKDTKVKSQQIQPTLSVRTSKTKSMTASRMSTSPGGKVTIQEGTTVSANSAGASGNSTPVSEYTTVAARTEGTNREDMGVRHTVVNQQAEKKLYITMSTKKKLVQLSLTDKMEAPVIREIPFEISSLAYDSSAHSLLWLSKVNKSAGRFDSHYIPKAVWHFPTSPIEIAIDHKNRLLYMISKTGLEAVSLEGRILKYAPLGNSLIRLKRLISLFLGSGNWGTVFANSQKGSVLLVSEIYGTSMILEISKKDFRRKSVKGLSLKSAAFMEEVQEFLFCDTNKQLFRFSVKTWKKNIMRLKCPPQVVRLLYYKGTLCAITPDRVYTAQIGTGTLTKQLPSQMTPLEVDKDMVSPIAELIEM